MDSLKPLDPIVTFSINENEAMQGTLVSVQPHAMVMKVYNTASLVRVSEVLENLTLRCAGKVIFEGQATVTSLVNTGLALVVSATLNDHWLELGETPSAQLGQLAQNFVSKWVAPFEINRDYQLMVSQFQAFLSEAQRWVYRAELPGTLPREPESGRIREDVFLELATPIMQKIGEYLSWFEREAQKIPENQQVAHRNFAQAALHPLLLSAPFIYRAYVKPMGYAGDYGVVNQILSDPRQGPSTYAQIVNTAFLKSDVAQAHRNRIDILVTRLSELAEQAHRAGRTLRVLSVGCGPAMEVQRFIAQSPWAQSVAFVLLDFSAPTLRHTSACIDAVCLREGKAVKVEFVQKSVQQLLKQSFHKTDGVLNQPFDFVYCAGLFDYLSDKICAHLLQYFVSCTRVAGTILVTNVHSNYPTKLTMGHLLEWYLIYRDENQLHKLLPTSGTKSKIYTEETKINVFAELQLSQQAPLHEKEEARASEYFDSLPQGIE